MAIICNLIKYPRFGYAFQILLVGIGGGGLLEYLGADQILKLFYSTDYTSSSEQFSLYPNTSLILIGIAFYLLSSHKKYHSIIALSLGIAVLGLGTIGAARILNNHKSFDVVLLDNHLPDGDGLALVPEILRINDRAIHTSNLEAVEQVELYHKNKEKQSFTLIGDKENIREIQDLVLKAAGTNASVLITGETGTEKMWWPRPFISREPVIKHLLSRSIVLRCPII